MLVLSRKEGERLVIDGNIVITVVKVGGGGVRLGIEAPPAVSIKRTELLSRPNAGVKSEKIAPTAAYTYEAVG
jgi:carbon storage regulator